ncbi:Outer membrane protein transport protein (OMPP1/FadL/TodX) [Cnuella takakiae]|uniref:Outer membrane protein transport protein (OMPP1/FadL/TodX) n=1 Tax=Cnuella takakiae TaxID=1302690 RepID=A0A1M4YC36_9BACT|nr:outer membrane protein transport protein [Cnuella takakiae]OLY93110.1 hypothetical protein BUE76_15325 [Cnuella takakiae]SHF03391.1 Outer membrane protein transport protein (OMPP1/FadL/TodX) [Cnuella takakiae]
MKRICTLSLLLFSGVAFGQEPADALRTGWQVPGGTARVQAIGGAMCSLGGDITATFVNPAGLAFYRTGDLVLTPQVRFGTTKSTYLGTQKQDNTNKLTWGTSGFVFGGGSNTGNVKSAAFSLAYNRTGDFNSDIFYEGANPKSSFSQRYLEEARGLNANAVAQDFPYGASLALNTYYIDTTRAANGSINGFKTLANSATGLLQRQTVQNRGGIDEFALAGAANINDKLMIGGTLGFPYLRYNRESQFIEADATDNTNNNFDAAVIEEDLRTRGWGLNLKLGMIYKPEDSWRLGFAFHTPTLYNLTDNYFVRMNTNTENYQGEWSQTSEDITGARSDFRYMLITPYRLLGSISYVLREVEDVSKQKGFLTADVEYVNYKAASFQTDADNGNDQSTKDYLRSLNTAIDNAYKGAFNFKVGGELKFTTLMVRAGAAYFGNPYQDINGEKGSRTSLSGGLGYRNRGFFIDLTYVHALNRDVHFAYRLENPAFYAGAQLRQQMSNAVMTFGFKF